MYQEIYAHEPYNFIQITFMCVFSVCKLILMFTLFVYIFNYYILL